MINDNQYTDILEKISALNEIGVDYNSNAQAKQLYQEAKDARNEARRIERDFYKNEGEDTSNKYWQIVADHALTLLVDYSRDINVLVWLIESYCRIDGYQGLNFALQVSLQIFETFNHDLYPLLEPGEDFESQLHSFIGLNGEGNEGSLIKPIKNIIICEDPVLVIWQYHYLIANTSNVLNIGNEDITISQYMDYIRQQGSDYLDNIILQVEQSITLWEKLSNLFQEYYQNIVPTTQIKNALENTLKDYNNIRVAQFGEKQAEVIQANEMSIEEIETNVQVIVKTRQQYIEQLKEIAQYFQVNEPHSPIPSMLNRIYEWSNLSWTDLMARIIKSPDEMLNISEKTGMPIETIED